MPHPPIRLVFQSGLLRVIDHHCAGDGDTRGEVPDNFSVTFRKLFGINPSGFRDPLFR